MKKLGISLCLLAGSTAYGAETISSNPSAVNTIVGTGALGKVLGLNEDSGARLGGLWILDYNYLFRGGLNPQRGGGDNLFQLNFSLDFEKLKMWKGGKFAVEMLQYNGSPINIDAGTVQGYNSLQAAPPIQRTELYQLWYFQSLFDDKFRIRIGKVLPSVDFNNVSLPLGFSEEDLTIASVTGLIYTPIFTNPSMLGVLPGYYDSAWGITLNFYPHKHIHVSYGIYDGNLARGVPTGLRIGPEFNSYRFQIGQVGGWWKLFDMLPGKFGIGGWGQTGRLVATTLDNEMVSENGIQGVYLFGSQRLWLQHSGKDSSGIVSFIQYGINNSKTLPMNHYYGAGLTFIGLIPGRIHDSFGCGVASSQLNPRLFVRKRETILQLYTQHHLWSSVYALGAFTYIIQPGAAPDLPNALAGTVRVIALF